MISRKSGHNVGKVVIVEAIIASEGLDPNLRAMEVIPGERNKGMNGIRHPSIPIKSRVLRFGSKGSFMVQVCMTESVSGDTESEVKSCLSSRILRAYFRKRAHSIGVGSLLKDFRIKKLRKEKRHVSCALTLYLPSFQISLRSELSNVNSLSCVPHNVSSTGSSKLLQQHAKLTALPFPLDATSSWPITLTISSTLRQACIESGWCV